jgi:acetyl esterase/lipase
MIRKNIQYATSSSTGNLLDVVYDPSKNNLPVIFFVHGGSWMSGSKDMYSRLGSNFLSRGFVTVLISYRLFPETDIYGMAEDCRAAFRWCCENISQYGGDHGRIYLAGHSAGGHLAAVTGLTEKLKCVRGYILIDAFGLSAWHFLNSHSAFIPENFTELFGKEAKKWSGVAPDKLADRTASPFLILLGGKTYPVIQYDSERFAQTIREQEVPCELITIPGQSHMQMIYLFENADNSVYDKIHAWMKRTE